jgi:two-component system, cell cycle sensor histidine kinase and response regulator CckA
MAVILVVDDDANLRSLAQIILEQQGYRVLVAGGGPQALQIARAEPGPIDLLVTDLVMPGMDGAELGRQLRTLRPATRVLYVTALAAAHLAGHTVVLNQIVLDPEVPILLKPFSIEALELKVQDVLASTPAPTPDAPSRRPGLPSSGEPDP